MDVACSDVTMGELFQDSLLPVLGTPSLSRSQGLCIPPPPQVPSCVQSLCGSQAIRCPWLCPCPFMTRSENCVGKELLRPTTEQIPCACMEQGLQANSHLPSAFPTDTGTERGKSSREIVGKGAESECGNSKPFHKHS